MDRVVESGKLPGESGRSQLDYGGFESFCGPILIGRSIVTPLRLVFGALVALVPAGEAIID